MDSPDPEIFGVSQGGSSTEAPGPTDPRLNFIVANRPTSAGHGRPAAWTAVRTGGG